MKKTLFALCALTLLLAGCDPEETPKVTPELKLTTEAAVTVPTDGDIVNVEFTSNVDWTAAIDVEKEVASLNVKSGTKDEGKVKVTVMPLKEDNAQRVINLTLTPEGGDPVKVVFTQNGPYVPFFEVSEQAFDFGIEGGTKTFTISTNVEYTVSETTIGTLKIDGEKAEYTMPASKAIAPRVETIVFTIEAIQVPSEEPGKTVAKTVEVTFTQEGTSKFVYTKELSEDIKSNYQFNAALTSDYYLVANGTENLYAFNKTTGELVSSFKVDFPVTGIANDSVGNIVAMTGGEYNGNIAIYLIPAKSPLDKTTYVKVVDCSCSIYGYAVDNITANGNVFEGDALITAFNGQTAIAWALKDGKRTEDGDYTDYVGMPEGSSVASAKCGVMRHLSTDINGGIYFSGYDNNGYYLWFNDSMSKANWQNVAETGCDWQTGVSSIDFVEFGGHKYLFAYAYGFFNYSTAYVIIYNIDTPSKPERVGSIPFVNASTVEHLISSDMIATIEDGKIAVYIIDAIKQAIAKIVVETI